MSFRNLLLFLFSYMLLSISLTTGQRCYNTGNFTTNSTYAKNRNLMLASLASNVTINGGFYNTTIGQDPDKVYGLAVCRGDSTSEVCNKCVNTTIQDIIGNCPNQKEVLSWGGDPPCIIRYADHSISGKLELSPEVAGYNVNNVTSNLTEFNEVWESLMDRVVRKASVGSSKLKFGTEEANLTHFQKIYALMQCTPDISQGECDTCLRQNVAGFQSCCGGKQGGYFHRPSCIFRWDLYPFYTVAPAVAPSPSSIPPPPPQTNTTIATGKKGRGGGRIATTVVIIVFSTIIIITVCVALFCVLVRRKRNWKQKISSKQRRENAVETETVESLQFDFSTIKVATNDFSSDNKLGQGGFGAVYKGSLSDGRIIAVKRLASNSEQGELEFKNEILLVAGLQHRNLVRLFGFCLEGSERLLIYEFVPNSSLDNFIFDPVKRLSLNWEKRYKIIGGIARGILYLHEDSRLRIIHRDLKASNILLDQDMNPKISDFGMARLFERDQTQADTGRVVGTFGYMAPEYVMHGNFSVKSDVFSFGVLVLEIISGQKNSSFHNGEETGDLLTFAWESWRVGIALNVIDPILRVGSSSEMMRCIHIGLLCVQENVANRPTMASVVLMLNSYSISLPLPTKPAFFMHTTMEMDNPESTMSNQSKSRSVEYSINEVSITELDPR
ncbi:hypothetical protein Ddye_013975 [Dipteronia dyeriana]|uniref:Cysteine-rich receptor-like protein kinase n=1 Tax=Dipteronia dyeriana TaxID=168575 RepID=A0AAD9X7D5_9ROSI|nr:hypothetical protein Ddye_013975 [Dipteronia dyeriana]